MSGGKGEEGRRTRRGEAKINGVRGEETRRTNRRIKKKGKSVLEPVQGREKGRRGLKGERRERKEDRGREETIAVFLNRTL